MLADYLSLIKGLAWHQEGLCQKALSEYSQHLRELLRYVGNARFSEPIMEVAVALFELIARALTLAPHPESFDFDVEVLEIISRILGPVQKLSARHFPMKESLYTSAF